MNSDLAQAARLLQQGVVTCALCKGQEVLTSTERGVKPLLDWIESGRRADGFSAADKVVGRAAAFLYVHLGVKEVYAPVMSEAAAAVLSRYGIVPHCDTSVKIIRNRSDTGLCPMEQAVREIDDPASALATIREKLHQLPA